MDPQIRLNADTEEPLERGGELCLAPGVFWVAGSGGPGACLNVLDSLDSRPFIHPGKGSLK